MSERNFGDGLSVLFTRGDQNRVVGDLVDFCQKVCRCRFLFSLQKERYVRRPYSQRSNPYREMDQIFDFVSRELILWLQFIDDPI